MASIKKIERTTSESKKISSTVGLDLFIKIENEAKKRNMKISEFVRKVLSDYFNQDKTERDNQIIKLEKFTSTDSQTYDIEKSEVIDIEKSEVIDIDSHKLKKIADKFNENLDTSEKEETEAEFRRLLRAKKRKENKYNGSS